MGALIPVACWIPFARGDFSFHERMLATSFGIVLYLAVFLLATVLVAANRRDEIKSGSFVEAWRRALRWVLRWHGLTATGIIGGAILGVGLALLFGLLRPPSQGWARLLAKGAANGAFYLLIWTPGLALVICFMQAFGPENGADDEKKIDTAHE